MVSNDFFLHRNRRAGAMAMLWLALTVTGPAFAAGAYSPTWNATCGLGKNITEGCTAVRARSIVDARKYPWSAIGRINIAGPRSRRHCTGVLIGERLVLTAAHCLYVKRPNRWVRASEIHFVAGFQRGAFIGHSKAVRYVVSGTHDVSSTVYRYRADDDWALIELRDPVGARAGYLGWAALDGAGLKRALRAGATVALAGYPSIRKHVMSVEMACKDPRFHNGGKLLTLGCASMKGDSGAPLLLLQGGKAIVVAVLSGAFIGRGEKGVVTVSAPITTFQATLLKNLGSVKTTNAMGGLAGLPGRTPSP